MVRCAVVEAAWCRAPLLDGHRQHAVRANAGDARQWPAENNACKTGDPRQTWQRGLSAGSGQRTSVPRRDQGP
jgi:hypothetical protein